jgi:catechol 2,3-dioxygenase-like lactoylglutathione lyase family enzyme
MKQHVSVITIGVADIDRAKRFYGDGLGWPVLQDYPGRVSFEISRGTAGWKVAAGSAPQRCVADSARLDFTAIRSNTCSVMRTCERIPDRRSGPPGGLRRPGDG